MGRNGADFTGENNPKYRHGLTDGKTYRHPVYTAWQNMKARCYNPNNAKYPRYGGRGITVCDEWLDSSQFAKWAFENGWRKGLTIDRVNNDGNYEPSNCKWISKSANPRKKSTTKLTYQKAREIYMRAVAGENRKQLAIEFNVSPSTVAVIVNGLTWKVEHP